MPRSSQIIPEHRFPHQVVVINDNTMVTETPSSSSGDTNMLFVFASPRGKDRELLTIDTGLAGFIKEYGGLAPFSLYGQPYLNAYNVAATGAATLHCLRVTADDATYAVSNLVAKYKIDDTTNKMIVKFEEGGVDTDFQFTDAAMLDSSLTAPADVDADGFTTVKIMSVMYKGRGSWGKNVAYRIINNATYDKENDYKNYVLEVYTKESGLSREEEFPVVFNENAVVNGVSYFADAVVNDEDSGSDYVQILTYADGIKAIVDAYNAANTASTLTVGNFDIFFGMDKTTKKAIENYEVDTATAGTIAVNSTTCISLTGGSDGSLDANAPADTYKTALESAYLKAWTGEYDPYIKSKNKYPTNFIFDANYPIDSKKAIATLAATRKDCVAILDIGTSVITKSGVLDYVNENLASYVSNRVQTIEAYAFKVKDPYNMKVVTVTSTYWMAPAYANHIASYGGKHVPMAGNVYGVIDGYIKNSIYPVFDEDLDADMMDELVDNNINFARLNCNQEYIRAIQNTRNDIVSNLTELNNVLVLLDIKRDCERLCTTIEYNFSEPTDIERFNTACETILLSYQDAQVRSISAHFDKNDWEAERGIIHLYVEMVHKDLVKTSIIEIDVNRS